MPAFQYEALKPNGAIVKGSAAASDRVALKAHLREQGLMLSSAKIMRSPLGFIPSRRKAGLKWELDFIRRYRSLYKSNLPVTQILGFLQAQEKNSELATELGQLLRSVQAGQQLYEAMQASPGVFSQKLCVAFSAGTKTGQVDEVLQRVEQMVAARLNLEKTIRAALAYPAFLMIMLSAAMLVLMLFVLPRFTEVYAEFGSELPLLTRIVMGIVEYLPYLVAGAAAALFLIVTATRFWLRRESAKILFDALKLHIPITGRLIRDLVLNEVCHLLAVLLRNGTPLAEAVTYSSDNISNQDMRSRLRKTLPALEQGQKLSSALAETKFMPENSLDLIRIGEESGDLSGMFMAVSELHRDAMDERLQRITVLIEPVMMVTMGLV